MDTDEKLSQTLTRLLERSHGAEELTLGEVMERIGDRGFGILLVILSLPSALPLPAAGYSTPFGLILCVLALQMLAGRTTPWIPKRARNAKLHGKFVDMMLAFFSRFFSKIEVLIRPRWGWVNTKGGRGLLGVLVFLMAFLMVLPIPLTNTFPAFVIFLIGIGLTEDDGLFALFGGIVAVISTFLYAFVIYLFIHFGVEGVERLKGMIKGWFGVGGGEG
ncbi:MAG: exopolysaccharide biosynthesis protein [Chthoniobacterales bacterium]|nr:exopolysaccharide biosynthesis protein [Chthoniobacterales bacterium]MCX7713327.1 exopolysaccharide biosynthesis protein [Chthoniobacterales bacterium]